MKKTFTLSISNRVFKVEEDAYALLLDYLESLSQVFKGDDGNEIVNDIEGRISEILQEEADNGKVVFTLADAESVIATIGNAAQLAEEQLCESGETTQAAGVKSSQCPPATPYSTVGGKRKLYRSESDKVLGGVLSGLATRFGTSVLPLRIIVVLLIFPLDFFPVFIAYCIAWAIIPLANTPERKLEQLGRPLTVANIGDMLSTGASQSPSHGSGATFFRVLGVLFMGFLGLVAGVMAIIMIIAIVAGLGIFIASVCDASIPLDALAIQELENLTHTWEESMAILSVISFFMAILIPCIAMVWASCNVLFKVKGASKAIWITAIIIEVICIVIPCVFMAHLPVD